MVGGEREVFIYCDLPYYLTFFTLRNLLYPAKIRPAAEIPIIANNAANGVLSPVFGELPVLVGVLRSSHVAGDSGFSLTVTVCPLSLMSLCSATLIGSSGFVTSYNSSNVTSSFPASSLALNVNAI